MIVCVILWRSEGCRSHCFATFLDDLDNIHELLIKRRRGLPLRGVCLDVMQSHCNGINEVMLLFR